MKTSQLWKSEVDLRRPGSGDGPGDYYKQI